MKKLNGTVIVTYRCNARCNMCNRYKKPSLPEEEISIETIKKLPSMYFTNITGGEPFIRTDLKEIVRELYKKSDRIEIVKHFGLSRIVLETDAPYLAPVPHRGKRNEPAYTTCVAHFIAEALGTTEEEVAQMTTANAKKLFNFQ